MSFTSNNNSKSTANVFEIKRFAVHDGDGIRTTIFLKGCPLRCVWCHNPEGLSEKPNLAYYAHKCIGCGECVSVCKSGAHIFKNAEHVFERDRCIGCGMCEQVCLGEALKLYGKEMNVDECMSVLLEDRDFYENSGGGVTISGGECLMQADFCAELLKRLKAEGVNTAVDTCGDVPRSALDKVIPYTDVFLFDLKSYTPEVHKSCTGRDNLRIIDNLRYLDAQKCNIEIRIPYVPGYNCCELEKIAELISTLNNVSKVRVLPYHSYAGSKYAALDMVNTLPDQIPTNEEMEAARRLVGSISGKKIVT